MKWNMLPFASIMLLGCKYVLKLTGYTRNWCMPLDSYDLEFKCHDLMTLQVTDQYKPEVMGSIILQAPSSKQHRNLMEKLNKTLWTLTIWSPSPRAQGFPFCCLCASPWQIREECRALQSWKTHQQAVPSLLNAPWNDESITMRLHVFVLLKLQWTS